MSEVDCRELPDLAAFRQAAGPLLEADPVSHNVMLGLLHEFEQGRSGEVRCWTAARDGIVLAAALQTPPLPVLVAESRVGAADHLARFLAGTELPGVAAPSACARSFAECWARHAGAHLRPAMEMRLLALGRLRRPEAPVGGPHVAGPAEGTIVEAMAAKFGRAVFHSDGQLQEINKRFDLAWRQSRLFLWQVDGETVAVAAGATITPEIARIVGVYTEPAHRGRGFAAAVTAALAEDLRAEGFRDVVLYADLANPTAGGVYRRLGFAEVSRLSMISFGAAP